MAVTVIYVHRTCSSSYKLYLEAKDKGLLSGVEIRPAATPRDSSGNILWSVPWLLVAGKPAGADPIPVEVVEAAVSKSRISPPRSVEEAFMETVLHSSAASSMAALAGGLEPVLDEALASAAVKSPLTGVGPREVLEAVGPNSQSLLEEWSDRISRALALGFVREAWWSRRGDLGPEELRALVSSGAFRLWLLAKGSIGRAVLPGDPRSLGGSRIVEEAESFLDGVGDRLISRVELEQLRILGDEEWKLVSEKGLKPEE